MADVNLSPYTAEQQAMDRRRKMAEAMQQQAVLPIEMPTVPGAKVSHLQGLAKLLQGYIAGKNIEKSDAEQKAYENSVSEDTARLFRNMGKTETMPGEVITPGQESMFIPENVTRYNETINQPESFTPQERNAAIDLPFRTEAVAPTYGPDRQVPLLSADLLNPTNPNAMKTGQGKQMLAQYLMQQEAQKQAATQAQLAAQQQIHSVAPGASLFQGGKPIYTNPKDSPPREIKTNDPLTGMPITKYVPENVLVTLGNIPDQYKGFAADLITANNLPAQITNNPQLLNLIGSQLNKQAGQVTQEDVANYMLKVAETRAKLGYEGIPFPEPKPIVAAGNPLVRPLAKITTKAEIAEVAKKSGKTIEQVTADAIAKGYEVK
jgi:hypothetical protein